MPVVEFRSKGVATEVLTAQINEGNKNPKKRKKIKSFSMSSRRRMREFLFEKRPPKNWISWSGTFTIAGPLLTDEQQSKLWADFSKNFLNKENCCCIWRKEVQKRGAVHWHATISAPKKFPIVKVYQAWWQFINNVDDMQRLYLPGATKQLCQLNQVTDSALWARYMQDHMTKHKKEQEAKTGRHWGVVNRNKYRKEKIQGMEFLTDEQYNKYLRIQRRYFKPFKKNKNSPFGYSLGFSSSRGTCGRSVFFSESVRLNTLKRIIAFVRSECPIRDDIRSFDNSQSIEEYLKELCYRYA